MYSRVESMLFLRRRSHYRFCSLRQLRRYIHLFCSLLTPIYKELGQFLRRCASKMSCLRRINPYFTTLIPHWWKTRTLFQKIGLSLKNGRVFFGQISQSSQLGSNWVHVFLNCVLVLWVPIFQVLGPGTVGGMMCVYTHFFYKKLSESGSPKGFLKFTSF